MDETTERQGRGQRLLDERPAIVVSCDGHIGPRLEDDLRPYCPQEHLDEFDAFARGQRERRGSAPKSIANKSARKLRNLELAGHHDIDAYLHDMDVDGIAAEVLYQGSQNGHGIPFMPLGSVPSGNALASLDLSRTSAHELEMFAVGQTIYNRWLADAVSVAPDRLVGLVHIPFWDPELAAQQVRWAGEHGLGGVNFPAPRPGMLDYADRGWDPLWRACEELGMALSTHAGGAGDAASWTGPHGPAMAAIEASGWLSRRAVHFMTFGGVFERFPDLTLVLTEQPGIWWAMSARDYDSLWHQLAQPGSDLRVQAPRPPSEYMSQNVYVGASFMSRAEADAAVDGGYVARVLWGRDYPHVEGTFQAPEFDGDPPQSRLAIRDALAGCSPDDARRIVGLNGVAAYGLDAERLAVVAQEIGAPTQTELVEPLETIPESHGTLAFRRNGAYG